MRWPPIRRRASGHNVNRRIVQRRCSVRERRHNAGRHKALEHNVGGVVSGGVCDPGITPNDVNEALHSLLRNGIIRDTSQRARHHQAGAERVLG
jgi:hypothetical protein